MAQFKDMLKFYREQRGLSQTELGKIIGIATSTISMYEQGRREPDFETEEKIADFFNVSLSNLRGRSSEANTLPVYARVAAGVPLEASGEVVDFEEIPEAMARTGDFFGLRVVGDSMEPKISDGDTVIVRKQEDAENGEIVVVLVNGSDACIKRLKKFAGGIMLLSTNPAYEPITYTAEETDSLPVRIVGKVVELRAKF